MSEETPAPAEDVAMNVEAAAEEALPSGEDEEFDEPSAEDSDVDSSDDEDDAENEFEEDGFVVDEAEEGEEEEDSIKKRKKKKRIREHVPDEDDLDLLEEHGVVVRTMRNLIPAMQLTADICLSSSSVKSQVGGVCSRLGTLSTWQPMQMRCRMNCSSPTVSRSQADDPLTILLIPPFHPKTFLTSWRTMTTYPQEISLRTIVVSLIHEARPRIQRARVPATIRHQDPKQEDPEETGQEDLGALLPLVKISTKTSSFQTKWETLSLRRGMKLRGGRGPARRLWQLVSAPVPWRRLRTSLGMWRVW